MSHQMTTPLDRTGELRLEKRDACHDWPLGKCPYGTKCRREHHHNLDPALCLTREHNYDVPNTPGDACVGCVLATRPCDKKGRGGDDDPCSECRWFGGASCRCSLDTDITHNDHLFKQMMVRADFNYTLAENKSRETPRGKKKVVPTPMPDSMVKRDWVGETKEQLLAKPDMLPPHVRKLPRAYLVPPRPSGREQKSEAFKQSEGNKRKREAESTVPGLMASIHVPSTFRMASAHMPSAHMPSATSILPQFPPPPSFPRPPADALHGEVVRVSWSYTATRWEYTYASGAKMSGPSQSVIASRGSAPTPSVANFHDGRPAKKQR